MHMQVECALCQTVDPTPRTCGGADDHAQTWPSPYHRSLHCTRLDNMVLAWMMHRTTLPYSLMPVSKASCDRNSVQGTRILAGPVLQLYQPLRVCKTTLDRHRDYIYRHNRLSGGLIRGTIGHRMTTTTELVCPTRHGGI
jgi:hypothetical protein